METFSTLFGIFTQAPLWTALGTVAIVAFLGFVGAPLWLWTLGLAAALFGFGAPVWVWAVAAALALALNIPLLRRQVITRPVMSLMKKAGMMPTISPTQRTAIESGSVWLEGELFSGRPDFDRILGELYPTLTDREQAFMDGPVEQLCELVDDWEAHVDHDLPEEAWQFMREHNFWGMIIPEEYGGLDFSAAAHGAIIQKLASHSVPLAVTVMVPNSLGPAELLLNYGTDEQKDHYLPRLADGREIPCFALTEPTAGSDATAVEATGVLFEAEDGELAIRLNWEKRYITLGAVSTLLGLAFRLQDPDGLLGDEEEVGITCALIPSDADGVVLTERHDPLGVPFINGPTEGHDVVVAADQIIGGIEQAGNGWKMLTEALSEGRGVSLPSQAAGIAQRTARVVGAYATIRQQFGLPIAKFEGVEEQLSFIGGQTYLMEALRNVAAGGLDSGAKPAVVSAIAKYNATESQRDVVNAGMDVLGGAGIVRGPRNLLANMYMSLPIGITVEGANIMTRTLMIFGQGLIRCHPYAFEELVALEDGDLATFDRSLFSHLGFVVRNFFRAGLLSLSRGWLAGTPGGPLSRYWRRLSWSSAYFALLADLALGTLGGKLQRGEKLTGRFADALSWMFIAMAVLKRFESEGHRDEHLPFARWALDFSFAKVQEAFDGLRQNLPVPGIGLIALWGNLGKVGTAPTDAVGHEVADAITKPGELRDWLTAHTHVPRSGAFGRLEEALNLAVQADDVYQTIRHAQHAGDLPHGKPKQLADDALDRGVIDREQHELLERERRARRDVIAVDAFPIELMNRQGEVLGPVRRPAAE